MNINFPEPIVIAKHLYKEVLLLLEYQQWQMGNISANNFMKFL